jgi:hypothetical protein
MSRRSARMRLATARHYHADAIAEVTAFGLMLIGCSRLWGCASASGELRDTLGVQRARTKLSVESGACSVNINRECVVGRYNVDTHETFSKLHVVMCQLHSLVNVKSL